VRANVGVHLLAEAGEARCSQSGATTGYAEPNPEVQPVKWRKLAQGESLRARSERRQQRPEAHCGSKEHRRKAVACSHLSERGQAQRGPRTQRDKRAPLAASKVLH